MPILDRIAKLDKVLILGFAREGESTQHFLKDRFPHLNIDTTDQKDGPDYLARLADYPLVIKSPGVSPHKPEIVAAQKSGTVFTSHMQIFFEVCPSPKTIGVTGTKGKSTTTSLIHHVLLENSISSILVGNIGKPALDFLPEITPDTWVATELSSYQLVDLTVSPHIAVLQNIYPDHLDYHKDFAEYKTAKLNITKYQTADDYLITAIDIPTRAKKIIVSVPDQPVPSQLLGTHSQLNIRPAVIIGEILNLPKDKVLSAISTFKPLETRLEFIAEKRGVKFYADTLATIPEAAIAAIDTLHPATLIAGGHDRRQDYKQLAQKIIGSGIRTLILFPATGPRIWQEVQKHLEGGRMDSFQVNSMSEAVKLSFTHTSPGSICLLSPAAPSFTLFKDYRDEHRQFKLQIERFGATLPPP